MSKQLAELCALLVRHEHGDLPYLLYSTLLERDRLSLLQLIRITGLARRSVKNGLAILISHKLITFYPTGPIDETFYEADLLRAYNLIRAGRDVELIWHQYGALASDAAVAAQVLGLVTISQLAEEVANQPVTNDTNGHLVNGDRADAQHQSNTLNRQRAAVQRLQEEGVLDEVRDVSFMSDTDLDLAVREWLQANVTKFSGSVSGPKKSQEFQAATDDKKYHIKRGLDTLDDPESAQARAGQDEHVPKRRKANDKSSVAAGELNAPKDSSSLKHKRSQIKNNVNEDTNEDAQVDAQQQAATVPSEANAPFYHIDHGRLALAHRSQVLSQYAARRLGDTTGKVYGTLLKVLEDAQRLSSTPATDNEDDFQHYVANVSQVFDALDPALASTLLMDADGREEGEREREEAERKREEEERRHGNLESEDDDASVSVVKPAHSKPKPQPINGMHTQHVRTEAGNQILLQESVILHLEILVHDPQEFVHYDKHFKKYSVDHRRLIRVLIQHELERTINARFGPTATRMVRILYDKGKLEEKQIGQFGLVQQKELRAVLASMQEAGFIDVQEIPRDNSRQPSRSIYLWDYNHDRTRTLILERIYKTMSRLLQRLEHEKRNYENVLEKSERSDIKDRKDELLSEAEKDALATLEFKEEKLLLQLSRLDELVILFRDCIEPMER